MRELVTADNSLALMVDMQEKLMPAMRHRQAVTDRTHFLLKAFRELELPVMESLQYPKGLGYTIHELQVMKDIPSFEKITYSCYQDSNIHSYIKEQNKKNILIFGVEAHICVLQTALDLASEGYQVYLICDCTDSRSSYDREIAFRRMEAAGIILTTSESLIYEMLGRAGTDIFKRISRLVKDAPLFD